MRVADTSAIYALFQAGDTHHKRAHEEFSKSEAIIVTPEVFAETLGLVRYRHGFDEARKVGEYLLVLPQVRPAPPTELDFPDIWQTFERLGSRLSYADASIVVHCMREEAEPLTFDKDLRHAVAERRPGR